MGLDYNAMDGPNTKQNEHKIGPSRTLIIQVIMRHRLPETTTERERETKKEVTRHHTWT